MERFVKMNNGYNPLTIFALGSILDAWQCFEYAFCIIFNITIFLYGFAFFFIKDNLLFYFIILKKWKLFSLCKIQFCMRRSYCL